MTKVENGRFDVIILGAGAAGLLCAITAAKRSTIPLAASSLKNDVKPFVIF